MSRLTLILTTACGIVAAISANAGWKDMPLAPPGQIEDRRNERTFVLTKGPPVGNTVGAKSKRTSGKR